MTQPRFFSLSTLIAMLALSAACSGAPEASPAPPATVETVETPTAAPASEPSTNGALRPTIQSYEVVATFPHDTNAFTQGLFFWQGILYESTGRHGQSTVRKTIIESGDVTEFRDIPPEYFGEGITRWQDKIIALTWRSGTGFVLDLETLAPLDAFGYPGEGWGITANDTHLIQSDGSNILRFLDPNTFEITDTLKININGKPLRNINELEWIKGEIWANVWQSELIARIDPVTGNVTAVIDFSGLFPASNRTDPSDDVLNGIAYDPATDRIFVTGKNWPSLFEVRVTDFSPPAE